MIRSLRWMLVLAAVALASLAIVGCSDDDDDDGDATATETAMATETATATEDASAPTIEVVLADFSVTPNASTATAGQVHFEAMNEGAVPHELVVIRSDAPLDGLPVDGAVVPEDEVDFVGEIEEFPAGETRTAAFNLEPGRYLLICNIAGHYQLGMRAELIVN